MTTVPLRAAAPARLPTWIVWPPALTSLIAAIRASPDPERALTLGLRASRRFARSNGWTLVSPRGRPFSLMQLATTRPRRYSWELEHVWFAGRRYEGVELAEHYKVGWYPVAIVLHLSGGRELMPFPGVRADRLPESWLAPATMTAYLIRATGEAP